MEGLIMAGQLILAILILVGVHELGHMVAARVFGMRVEKFFIGFPPRLFSFKKGDTEYGLGAIPLGGFVKISGMVDESMDTKQLSAEPQPWEFRSKPAWQRLIVMLGGVFVNVIVGILIFIGMALYTGDNYVPADEINKHGIVALELGKEIGLQTGDRIINISGKEFKRDADLFSTDVILGSNAYYTVSREGKEMQIDVPADFANKLADKGAMGRFINIRHEFEVEKVQPGTPAEKAGLKSGDRILQVNQNSTHFFDQLQIELSANKQKQINLLILRAQDTLPLTAKLSEDGLLGFKPKLLTKMERRPFGFLEAVTVGTLRSFTIINDQGRAIGKLFRREIDPQKALSGPIGIAREFGGYWSWLNFWSITGLLSMVLAFMNLLPIPALDGGHVVFLLFEMVSGRKPSDKFLEYAQRVGMVILLSLMVFAFYNDIVRLFT